MWPYRRFEKVLEIYALLWYSNATKEKVTIIMAITKNAKKALRVSTRRKVTNDSRSRTMKEAVKIVRKDVSAKDTKKSIADLSLAFKALDKAAKGGIIKKGTANRKKSRLAKAVAKIAK